ncbi:MAG: hypothetical protein LAT76_03030 [Schleiferiaceae bacterium]|nr:hypothetical protein [Schleiferiaceae bacterium]
MKKILVTLLAALFVHVSMAQVVTTDPEEIDPTASVKIIVNLNAMDGSIEHVQNLQSDAAAGLDIYFWTWLPKEHGPSHPLVNGTGGAPWKNSNDLLRMTLESPGVYSFTMVPVDFYEVDPADVYERDIHFLVKPKDGGGFGDPDRKSDDLKVEVSPPVTQRKPVFGFPTFVQQDDIFIITYDNKREEIVGMQNANAGDVYLFSTATLADSSQVTVTNYFAVGSNPDLEMDYLGNGLFQKIVVPFEFFGLTPGQQISSMRFIPLLKDVSARAAEELTQVVDCP